MSEPLVRQHGIRAGIANVLTESAISPVGVMPATPHLVTISLRPVAVGF